MFSLVIAVALMIGIPDGWQTAAPVQLTQQAQVELSSWNCRSELSKKLAATGGVPTFIRISPGVLAAFVRKRVQPETHGLDVKPEQQVFVQILADYQGDVACARELTLPQSSSDSSLVSRSLDAAKNWHFPPYYLNKQPVIVEATMNFRYKGSKVTTQP